MVPEAKRNGRADEESPRRGWLRHPRERDARPDGAWRVTRLRDSSARFAGIGMTWMERPFGPWSIGGIPYVPGSTIRRVWSSCRRRVQESTRGRAIE